MGTWPSSHSSCPCAHSQITKITAISKLKVQGLFYVDWSTEAESLALKRSANVERLWSNNDADRMIQGVNE